MKSTLYEDLNFDFHIFRREDFDNHAFELAMVCVMIDLHTGS